MTRRTGASAAAVVIGALSILTAGTAAGVAISASKKVKPVWPNGTIHQCVNNKTLATRTMPRGNKCSAKETAYSFSQKGPAGLGGAAVSGTNSVTPLNEQQMSAVKTVKITTTSRGSLVVLDADIASATLTNTSPSTAHYFIGVYVDGRGVPGTGAQGPELPPEQNGYSVAPVSLSPGILTNVPAGKHTVAIDLVSSDAQANYVVSSSGTLVVLASK